MKGIELAIFQVLRFRLETSTLNLTQGFSLEEQRPPREVLNKLSALEP